jgi:hypothetical protein
MRSKWIAGLVSLSWDGSSCGGQIGLETHLLADSKELLLCVQQLEEFTKILEGSHDYFPRFVSAALSETGSGCRARSQRSSTASDANLEQ